ncbi:unnamed protein product [Citrullus colocynthis]|uniref:Uncharacterized protein n=1 Tax=Citrullus colocynthis TaxID=252529 RepID=A0ABP0Z419_9ROSI
MYLALVLELVVNQTSFNYVGLGPAKQKCHLFVERNKLNIPIIRSPHVVYQNFLESDANLENFLGYSACDMDDLGNFLDMEGVLLGMEDICGNNLALDFQGFPHQKSQNPIQPYCGENVFAEKNDGFVKNLAHCFPIAPFNHHQMEV